MLAHPDWVAANLLQCTAGTVQSVTVIPAVSHPTPMGPMICSSGIYAHHPPPPILAALVLVLLACKTAATTAYQPVTVTAEAAETDCGFQGDGDTYGLGVRLGAYIQWLTSILAYNLSEEEAAAMRGVNTSFQIAMLAGLLVITVQRGSSLYAAEAYVVLLFALGGICSAATSPWKPKKRDRFGGMSRLAPSNVGALIRISLGTTLCAYGLWYSFQGLDHMRQNRCSRFAFIFARVSLYGWTRTLLKVVFTLGSLAALVLVANNVLVVILDCYEWLQNWTNADDDDQSTADAEINQPSWVTASISLLGLGLLVVAVELTLAWNHVRGVYSCGSTGQLFPLVVGCSGLLRLVYKLVSDFIHGSLKFGHAAAES
ncbi:hypothetical protein A1O3_09388 [Capronia epimyces CBS 606.96]|uniref:Uncharacterized protein n=1 Tax=Capronia epimyces CBS 606.96 TaxID=1182542 RepID=W9XCK8_9EURO|nr:uncharacterized protein A1O3_09388 [Capronia epimyces CBS 606.96]EXJ78227.1 hypothetical protein A1O3_09388 [Capronia epimyces CBS 606.96]